MLLVHSHACKLAGKPALALYVRDKDRNPPPLPSFPPSNLLCLLTV